MFKDRSEDPTTVSISVLSQLVRYLTHCKADIPAVFRAAGLDPDILNNPDRRLTGDQYYAVEEEGVRVAGDPFFGLHMGEFFEPGHWSVLGYMMLNCRTIGEAYGKMARYRKIVGNLFDCRIRPGAARLLLVFTGSKHAPPLSRHSCECVIAGAVAMIRRLTGRDYRPREVGFSHPAPPSTAEYERVFGCRVRFGRKKNYLSLDPDIVRRPVLLPDRDVLAHFERYADEYLSSLEGSRKISHAVIRIILGSLEGDRLNQKNVARELGISVRTLQERLSGEGASFRKLLEETRERLAKKYLAENYTVEEIACLLGFADAGSFRKAFKKWTGQTPREYGNTSSGGA
ncbi:MAG: AraC family transcriptional regulator [Spirochaetales bacterium]|nr:AraC family transcriptional regulator [Spirochaetales bacterium]